MGFGGSQSAKIHSTTVAQKHSKKALFGALFGLGLGHSCKWWAGPIFSQTKARIAMPETAVQKNYNFVGSEMIVLGPEMHFFGRPQKAHFNGFKRDAPRNSALIPKCHHFSDCRLLIFRSSSLDFCMAVPGIAILGKQDQDDSNSPGYPQGDCDGGHRSYSSEGGCEGCTCGSEPTRLSLDGLNRTTPARTTFELKISILER